jgi:FRG domain-containing protein
MQNEKRVASWDECEEEIRKIEKAHKGQDVWFRGHSSATWNLRTTLERRTTQSGPISNYFRLIERIKPEVETFTERSWASQDFTELMTWGKTYENFQIGDIPHFEYMAHLRHHGFPSPLLDWTRSPYIAAYFAFEPAGQDDRAIFVFCERPTNMKQGSSDDPCIRTVGPRVKTHKRHFLQQSVYTMCGMFFGSQWHFHDHHAVFNLGRIDQDVLWKIVIPGSERVKVLELLDRYNLNRYSLFGSEEGLMETLAFRHVDAKQR